MKVLTRHRMLLPPELKWRIFLESWWKGTADDEVCRRCRITSRQLRAIRAWARPSPVKDFFLSLARLLRDGLGTGAFVIGVAVFISSVEYFYAYLPIQAAQNWPAWGVLAVLPFFIIVLGVALFWLFEERRRRKLFLAMMQDGLLGWLSPLLIAGFVFVLAVSVFSASTFLLDNWEVLHMSTPSCEGCPLELDDVFNFYTWHLLSAIPLLNINESLQWNTPLAYSGALTGWLVIVFKASVIVPLIQAVRTYFQVRKETPRIRVRPWAWRRVIRRGRSLTLNWAPTPPPTGFVFDVKVQHPGPKAAESQTWLRNITETSGKFTPRSVGIYRFWVTCHERGWEGREVIMESLGLKEPLRSRRLAVLVRPAVEGISHEGSSA
ncbi:MAG: hypothetical protein ACRDGU_01490 [Actinomycetota bacterium]